MTNQHQQYLEEPIAIIGSACRLPGAASSPSKLWELLKQPRDVLKEFSADRLNLHRFYNSNGDIHGSTDVPNKSYILDEDVRFFDASFFGISPVEAAGMDPQQRILLEVVYEAFETAGMTLSQLKGSSTSVHVGVMTDDWSIIQNRDAETLATYTATGTASSIISNRISYVFDLKGPSVTINTACSSSLVALHHAARGLISGDSETAIVAGVNLILDPTLFISESKLHMLSPDSRSRMWDKAANGYARGEGAATLVLKPLSSAIRDGDHIEAVIRSTGVNSDGQSQGITMPFAPSQADLIRQTYQRIGLDPVKDRPQFFECHGTGTPAGDPVEARAISDSFVDGNVHVSTDNPMYVGSIKTVIGHLEGCAGLAGVIKVLLAIKNRTIPPNLLFNDLNPAISKYYGPLQIPTTAQPWPSLPAGTPARASVNSFGFGGTNAHAIIESIDPSIIQEQRRSGDNEAGSGVPGPLLFSAASAPSLLRNVNSFLQHLKQHPEINLRDLSWLLHTRRSTHRVRTYFSGVSREAIIQSMESFVIRHGKSSTTEIGYQPRLVNLMEAPGILGVFTGQGAQWPAMGRELIHRSHLFRRTIESCEAILRALPRGDAPDWSLIHELTADASLSRLSEAAISQPLCTAVQLALGDLLIAAGIRFDAVVGHSSGEIAATYVSSIISLEGAMQIAYYRGFHAHLAKGAQGQRGGMLAAGLSLAQAQEFCRKAEFQGVLQVAASNAPQSVTLSGDLDAIMKAKQHLDRDNIFARQLKVDTAYHSHHMQPCAEPYLQSLLLCNIQIRSPQQGCIWNSSVRGDTRLLKGDLSSLRGPYWVQNMVQTVLFSRAVESAIWHGGPFDLAIEVGPHPALKGPVEQTLKAAYGHIPLYTGVLRRTGSDVEAFSAALGNTWSQLGPSFIDINGYHRAFSQPQTPLPRVIKDLPTYSWDHDRVYWRESRISRRFRTGRDVGHELLGRRTPDDHDRELRWRNVLKRSEIPWVSGHEVLNEVLLPGAAYVSIAVQASQHLAAQKRLPIRLLEIANIDIHRPVTVPDNKDGVETLFTVRVLDVYAADEILRAQFSYYICTDETIGTMVHTCSGEISIHFGRQWQPGAILPPREPMPANLLGVDCGQVYSMFEGMGLNYSCPFRSIKSTSRCLNYATATGFWDEGVLSDRYVVHPAILDVAFQTLFVARAHPASGLVTNALLPSHIDRVRINPSVSILRAESGGSIKAEFDSWVVHQTTTSVTGDVNIYDLVSGETYLQVEGLETRMVGAPDPLHDRPIFSKTTWGNDTSIALTELERDASKDAELLRLYQAAERMSLFYVQRIMEELGNENRSNFQWFHQRMLEAFEEHIALVRNGQHPVLSSRWLTDTPSELDQLDAENPDAVELQILHVVGKNMVPVVRGELHMLEAMKQDDLLNRFYLADRGFMQINHFLAQVMQQISFKFPRCNILEIGAGTGATTWCVLNAINNAYDTYTYTDISAGFFPSASEKFAEFAHQMIFKILDIEQEPAAQGYVPHSYDVVIAANVLHATRNLENTMRHARSLLRPGGYLLLFELTSKNTLRFSFNFGGLSGWWLGVEDQRRLGPMISDLDWDTLLHKTGFSGADTVVHEVTDESKHILSLIVSQAVDDTFLRLQEPLSRATEMSCPLKTVLLVGGKTLNTLKMGREIQKILSRPWHCTIQTVNSLDSLDSVPLTPGMEVICLHELDEPLFSTPMTAPRLALLQSLLMNSRSLLWVACSGQWDTPRASMFSGIARVMPTELPQLHLQVVGLDFSGSPATAARHLVEAFLRLREMAHIESDNGESRNVLWALEPEMKLKQNGQAMISRIVIDKALNEVHIASTRAVTKMVDATDIAVKAVPGSTKMMLQAANISGIIKAKESMTPTKTTYIHVHHAAHSPGLGNDGLYLVCGSLPLDVETESAVSSVMAISPVNASVVEVEREFTIPIHDFDCTPDVLFATLTSLLVQIISRLAVPGQSVLFYEPDGSLAARVAAELEKQGSSIYFASSASDAPDSWIKIHAQASNRAIKRAIPSSIQLFVDCSNDCSTTSKLLRDCLPVSCDQRRFDANLLQEGSQYQNKSTAALLQKAYSSVKSTSLQAPDYDLFNAADLTGVDVSSLRQKNYVTDWQQRESLLLTTPALQLTGVFRPDRTYVMIGAAGGLGLSICQWMIRNGARHMIITSRKPQVDPRLLDDARHAGASVKIVPMDVSQKQSVETVIQQAHEEMPPIAGVCNAAMVLSDRLFIDMNIDQLNSALAPKVDGTEHLNNIFANDPLDFFVLLSSAATVVGNTGQANYHCANLFMTELVAQRRARGLSASIIHIGYVLDVGYVTRNHTRQVERQFEQLRSIKLSETDVHHAFAQAIRGGQPGSTMGSHDIIMGLQPPTEPDAPNKQAPWLTDPRLGHMVPYRPLHTSHEKVAATGTVKQLVQSAETEQGAVVAVVEAFCAKLESMLQLPAGSVQENVQRGIIDLGIDSLVAVEIRTWFLKELGAEIPVVKILGGDTVGQVCTSAAKMVLKNLERTLESPPHENTPATETVIAAPTTTPVPPPPALNSTTAFSLDHSHSPPLLDGIAKQVVTPATPSVAETEDDSGDSTIASKVVRFSETGTVSPQTDNTSSTHSLASDTEEQTAIKTKVINEAPMSPAQSRLWFLSKHLDDPTSYNMVFHYRVRGSFSIARFRHAFQVTTSRHECLRMCFYPRLGDGHPMQGVLAAPMYEMIYIPNVSHNELQNQIARFRTRLWDLEMGRTLGVAVLSVTPEEHDLVFGFHHIVTDMIGWQIFLRDLDQAYQMQSLGDDSSISHLEYSARQSEQEMSGTLDEHYAFWQAEFATLPDPLPLLPISVPSNGNSTETRHHGSHYEHRELDETQFVALKEMCQRLRISPFHFHLAVLKVLLARYTNLDDICVGVVDANRPDPSVAQIVGSFVNMLPIRTRISQQHSLAEVARMVSRKALAAFAHSDVPFDRILDLISVPRSSKTTPLFQVALNYRTALGWDLPLGSECKMALVPEDIKDAENPYDISVGIVETPTVSMVEIYCKTALYSHDACNTLLEAYMRVLADFLVNPHERVENCAVHDKLEVRRALELGKGDVMEFRWPATLSQRVLDICQLHSSQTAVNDQNATLSYAQLASRINAVADAILEAGGDTGSRIAVLCEPSVDAIVAMLAILHIGAVYVPLDISLPVARHENILQSCQPSLILRHAATGQRTRALIRGAGSPVSEVRVDTIPDEGHQDVPCLATANDPAILLFTSGSTGTPKGILLSQANFVNHLALKTHELHLGREVVLQQSSFGFDMSLIQIFCALANGGLLVIAPSDARRDPIELTKLIRTFKVSLTIATPSEYQSWLRSHVEALRQNIAWRHACMGGEPVSQCLKKELRRLGLKDLQFTNCYGPTEITAAATFRNIPLVEDNDPMSHHAVGRALPNYSVRILDAAGRPLPVDHTGEICIGGAGVALGYLNLVDEMRQKFIVDGNYQLYRTGDQGRLLSDGTLVCFGRLDDDTQIKLRGIRIELQEIESAIVQAADSLLSSVVVSRRGDVLVAHACLLSDQVTVDQARLAHILGLLKLPQYCIPSTIILLPSMPTNANGKLDRKAIAALPLHNHQAQGAEKMTVREGELRLLWERVLPNTSTMARIGPSMDFFLYGGNSLLLMKLQSAIQESIGVTVSTRSLYEASTLREMTKCIHQQLEEQQAGSEAQKIDWVAETALPVSLRDQIQELKRDVGRPRLAKSDGIEILLTGATSFLGGLLLRSLVSSQTVRKVHCIAIPADDQHLLYSDEKVECYTGTLLSSTLGLNSSETQRLGQIIDVIIHAGSSGHCLNMYPSLRTPNLLSTHALASLALPRAVPLLYLSTSRVVLLSGNTAPRPGSVAAFAPATDGREGYTVSKWASEVFLENAVTELQKSRFPWIVAVHRPCVLVSEHAPNSDALNAILRFSVSMRCVPHLERVRGYLDFGQVDNIIEEIAEAALHLAQGKEQDPDTLATIHFQHHSGGVKVPIQEFRTQMENVYGGSFEEVEMDEWMRRATKAGIDPLITAYLEGIFETGEPMVFPYLGEK